MSDTTAVPATEATTLRIDVGAVAPAGCRELEIDVFPPAQPGGRGGGAPVAVFCFPGGGMSRRYFDLAVPGYSFAAFLRHRGYLVVLVDHPGVGGSDTPADGWTLTVPTVADVNAAAVSATLDALAAGAVGSWGPTVPAAVVGVGHSAGAMVVIHQQARARSFDAIGLFGWAGRGLPEQLDDDDRALVAGGNGSLGEGVVSGARRRFATPFVELARGSSAQLIARTMPDDVHAALVAARSPLLAVVGYTSLLPGSSARAAAEVTVPVFVGVGERDIATGHRQIPAEFPSSRDVTLFVLPGAGHNQNVETNREALWERLAGWIASVDLDGRDR